LIFAAVRGLPASSAENEATLTADSMSYDPGDGSLSAVGNVHFKRPDGELFGDRGRGSVNGSGFEMHGHVRGTFDAESLTVACESITLVTEGKKPARRRIISSGDVVLTRKGDRLSARVVEWEMGSSNYKAAGAVLGKFTAYSVDADEVSREGSRFSALNLRKYEDLRQKVTISASKAEGLLNKNNEIVELTSNGSVLLTMTDSGGEMTRITGDRGVFSVDRGTIVVSGNSRVVQKGRSLVAESIVYHMDTRRVEAIGRPSMMMEMRE
jgi:lipopolysaccharide export system protein LptA